MKEYAKEVKTMSKALRKLSYRDLNRIVYCNNAFHVSQSAVSACSMSLDTNRLTGVSQAEHADFMSCIQPIINEEAINPPQLTIW